MTIENTTAQPSTAMLTEKELWSVFVSNFTHTTMSMGPTTETYKPNDVMRDPGGYDLMGPLANGLADAANEVDYPEDEINVWINEIETYLENVKATRDAFVRLKDLLGDDSNGDDPRYKAPFIHDVSEEAA